MFEDLRRLADALPQLLQLFERAVLALERIADNVERRDTDAK